MKVAVPDWIVEQASAPPAPAPEAGEVSPRLVKKARRSVECMTFRRKLERERRQAQHLRELRKAMRPPVVPISAAELRAARRGLVRRPSRSARPRGAGRPRGAASRSSARSGDSGDGSGSGGSEPPAALAGSRAGRGVPMALARGRAGS